MTLLSICTQIANDIPLAAPTSIVGNSDETAIRLLASAQNAGEALARKPQGGWIAMIKEFDFTTSAVAPQAGTIANVGGFGVISGLASTAGIVAGTWYGFGNGCPNNSIITAVTISSVTINQPATFTGSGIYNFGKSDYDLPADFERVIDSTMWDRSRYWQMRGPLSPQQWQLYKSSIIGQASIQRRFRFRKVAGATRFSIDPVPTDNGSPLVFEYVSNGWCQSAGDVPQNSWLADTDTGILDEYLLMLGTRWRVLRRLGFSYNEELDEYEREVSKAIAADGGAAILSLVPRSGYHLLDPYSNVPETGFGGPAS
jgi:hypothetical protein